MRKCFFIFIILAAVILILCPAAQSAEIIPFERRVDWSNAGVIQEDGTKGIPMRKTIFANVKEAPYCAAGSVRTTTGSIAAGSNQLTVSSPIDFAAGQGIFVQGEQAVLLFKVTKGADASLTLTVTISGNTFTPVTVAAGDTPVQVADKIRASVRYYLWIVGGDAGTDTVKFTTASNAAVNINEFSLSAGTSGVEGVPTVSAAGAADILTKVQAINGNTITLAANAATAVTDHLVMHDDSQAVQAAVNACPQDQVVYLPAGEYAMIRTVTVNRPLVIRGAGPDATQLYGFSQVFSFNQFPRTIAVLDWTSGYTKGDTQITLSDESRLTGVLKITAGARVSGTITLNINSDSISVGVAAGDTSAQVADKIRARYHAAWTLGGVPGTDTVTFRSSTLFTEHSLKVSVDTASLSSGMTAVTGEITIPARASDLLTVGQEIVLDELNDADIVYMQGSEGGTDGLTANSGASRNGTYLAYMGEASPRVLMQMVRITSIDGNRVTIDTPLYYTHKASFKPQVFYWKAGNLRYAGVEDIKINAQFKSAAIAFCFCSDCWLRNVEIDNIARGAVLLYYAYHPEVRDSYFYKGLSCGPTNYVIEMDHVTAGLVENNIVDSAVADFVLGFTNSGNVIAHNFTVRNNMTATNVSPVLFPAISTHDAHNYMNLFEGNILANVTFDTIWGSGSHQTLFRNRITGYLPPMPYNGIYLWSNYNAPIVINAYNRYINVVGNVLGTQGVHYRYEVASGQPEATNVTRPCLGGLPSSACGMGVGPIYTAGYYSGNPMNTDNFDPLTVSTLLRWGNFDYVTGEARWSSGEIPAGEAVPSSQELPASLYLNSKPSWWGNSPWPAIGPDVPTMCNKSPAQECFEKLNLEDGGAFNASACYITASLYGDVSGDGTVSAYDAALAAQAAVSLITLTDTQKKAADVSGDGAVSAYDAALIVQKAVGLISKFPVEGS